MTPKALVGIIANPASGKDIRRLVGHATTFDNQSKIGLMRCALIGMAALGVDQVLIMPDTQQLGARTLDGLRRSGGPLPPAEMLDMAVTDQAVDSETAAALMRAAGARCLLVLGGDGTARAVSKGAGDVPMLAVSTGTNNVLPSFVEGTVAGMAAGAVATGLVPLSEAARRHKWLELTINGVACDRALVDAVELAGAFVGSRAVWHAEDLRRALITRADPASIGLSAIAGVVQPLPPDASGGVVLALDPAAPRRVLAAIGPGLLREIGISAVRPLAMGERVDLGPTRPLVVALDGERERVLYADDSGYLTLRADGPWLVDAPHTMQALAARGFFERTSGQRT
jgi:predicted polyphosphate/ATP-dependent NAD kinase